MHPPGLEAESRAARRQQERRVRAGSPAATLTKMSPESERPTLRTALPEMASSGVEKFGRVPRHREAEEHGLNGVRRVGGVAQRHPLMQQPAGAEAKFELGGEASLRVGE
ncbi:hypothetical protein GCM10009778_09370 [Microbacterium terricola]